MYDRVFDEDPVLMFKRSDQNMDDRLDSVETQQLMPMQKYGMSLRHEFGPTADVTHLLDTDGNGYVSRDELFTFVMPRYEKSLAYHDFGEADRDQSKTLSLQEY